MIAVAAFWENASWVYTTPRAVKDRIRLWNFTMKAFGVSKLIMVDVDGHVPECRDAEITFELQASLAAVLDAHRDMTVVFLSQPTLTPSEVSQSRLKDFVHPTGDVLYVVGSDYGQLNFKTLAEGGYLDGNHVVAIKTPTSVPLWAHAALAITLYDRSVKQE